MPGKVEQPSGASSGRSGAIVADISREIVHVYAEFHGRGPTKMKTHWRDGMVICVLEDLFGTAERVLIEAGRFEQVRSNRLAVRDEIEPLLRALVENATGHRVETCMCQVSADDICVEIFVLGEPLPAALL